MTGFRNGRFFFLMLAAAACFAPSAQARELTLALANSACDAMSRAEALFRPGAPVEFTNICKSSGLLAKGLHGGALKADIFISADREWMDYAVNNGLVDAREVSSLWGNVLVVAVPNDSPLERLRWQDLATDRVRVILIGDPSNAPFGRHAKEAFEASGLWERVKGKIETRKNMELLAESLAASGPDTVGILFISHLTNQLRPLHTVRKELHQPIRYYMAPLKASADVPEVRDFLKFLRGRVARRVFEAAGFDVSAP